jgi:hypothetical protein
MLALLTSTTRSAEAPTTPPLKQYVFELETLDLGDRVRRGRTSFSGTVEFKIASAMSEDDLDAVNDILDDLQASKPDAEGYRDFSMSNGTKVRIGSFAENAEVAGAGVQSLSVELAVKDEFSEVEAAVVLEIAVAGNLFVASSSDPSLAATKTQVIDKRFLKRHKNYSVTPDDQALAEWIRKNIPPLAEASDEGDR